jgi:hypothetical protein
MSENTLIKSSSVVTEAPASWNSKYITPDGFVCQLTLRGESGKDLLEKANAALTWLKENGFLPCENNGFRPRNNGGSSHVQSSSTAPAANGNGNDSHICPVHHIEMRKWEKDGKVWYSHKDGDGWCTGKSK